MFDEFLNKAAALRSAECPFAVAIVVRYEPPVSGKPGDKAIIEADGSAWGWIGGGCVQPLIIQEALKAIQDGHSKMVRIAPTHESEPCNGIVNYAMTCHGGGALDVYIEPVLPKPQILIFGRSLAAQTLSKLGKAIGYRISVVAPGANHEIFPDADLVSEELDLKGVQITSDTSIVVSTQGEHDEEALEKALGTNTSYVSFIASVRKARKVFDFLTAKGLAPELLDRVRVPAGLRIGASSPHEISVSILAEIIQARKTRATEVAAEEATVRASVPVNAKDPVCGMAVEASIANYVSEYHGKVFYFCCSTCKQMFDRQPEAYGLALVEGL